MPEQSRIKSDTKNDQVFQLLRDEILTGKLPSGEIYSAASIAESLKVSRTPVNYAIKLLHYQGLVEMYPNVGFEVKPFDWMRIEERMQIKTQMEKLALWRMGQYASKSEIDQLLFDSAQVRLAIENKDDQSYYQYCKDLHFGICRAGKADLCLEYFEQYWDYEGWYAVKMQENTDQLLQLCDDHDQTLLAVKDGRIEEALALSEQHHLNCVALLRKNLDL